MGVFISDPLDPLKKLHELEVVGHVEPELLDIAILKSRHVHFFRIALCTSSLQTFSTLYTTRRVEQPTVTLHKGRAHPSEMPWGGKCDAPSMDGFSESPVLDMKGRVVGMLKDWRGDINGTFTTSEGLLKALHIIGGPKMTWGDWGIKAICGPGGRQSGQSARSNEKEGREDRGRKHRKRYPRSEPKSPPEVPGESFVTNLKRQPCNNAAFESIIQYPWSSG